MEYNISVVASETALKRLHRMRSEASLMRPNDRGAWREPCFAPLLGDAIPLVLDANVLRECVGAVAKRRKPIVLSTLANGLGVRVFCAPHVINEFEEHCDEWAAAHGVSTHVYRTAFREALEPFIRIVPTVALETMLLPHEHARINRLRILDSDDVPTATLAIVLGAVPITMDVDCWDATTGLEADTEQLKAWLQILMLIGDNVETQKLLSGSAAAIAGATIGTFMLVRRLFQISPLLGVCAFVGAFAAVRRLSGSQYASVFRHVSSLYAHFESEIILPHLNSSSTLRAFVPEAPDFEQVVALVSREAALGRACLYVLARSRCAPASRAADVSARLPFLAIGQDARRIGHVLRRFDAFFEPSARLWQVGRPIAKAGLN